MGTTGNEGLVFDIKRFATDDGPGIRTTIFMKGCPMRCWWCHNPEGQATTPELVYRRNLCISCGECIRTCSEGALSSTDGHPVIHKRRCNACGKCISKCSTGALSIVGTRFSPAKIIEEIEKDRAFYQESEGGITVSGGEPMFQPVFLGAFLSECKKRGIHTVVDTSGHASREFMRKIASNVDLFLYDLKIMDAVTHRKYTGVTNKQVLGNFKMLAERKKTLLVRFPIISGINDDQKNVKRTGQFISSCNAKQVCLLPYHRAGIEKYKNLQRHYRLQKTRTPSEKRLKSIKNQLETFGLEVQIGGIVK